MPPRFGFEIKGIQPKDVAFRRAGEAAHREFWRYIGQTGIEVYRRSREQGLDRRGEPLAALSPLTIQNRRSAMGPADRNAPPLIPAHGLSRTESLLRTRAYPDRAEFYWAQDDETGMKWGKILDYHRRGKGRWGRILRRDVIGLSAAERMELAQRGQQWWTAYQHGMVLFAAAEKAEIPVKMRVHEPPPKIPVTGRIDIEHATAGIGAELERTQRAIVAGYHTGFRQFKPGGLTVFRAPQIPPQQPPPPPPPRRPRPKPRPPKPAAKIHARDIPIPPALPTAPHTVTREELQEHTKDMEPIDKLHVIYNFLRRRQSQEETTGAFHGMTTPETYRSIEFEGVQFHFHPIMGPQPSNELFPPVARTIRDLLEAKRIPPEIANYTNDIYFTSQSNVNDAYWQKAYKMPGLISQATGSDGQIVVYRDNPILAPMLSHEMGHNVASGVYGTTDPPISSRFMEAVRSGEPAVSEYAKNSPTEDFAETIKLYFMDRDELRSKYPRRYQAIEALFHGLR